ncbi:HAMP domain-containing histidine kinase [Halonotius terrestris]|uniref:histidine kinase n=1 Tax=Halonotius terrestris TaxID=2487750 RepID=A0A8J8PBA0_9EURY|nr:HAMP domain-containing sensor histidine kinase [Halonotius terrestris]TQQ83239.1 HAMP domain-containing histidine kinase [Halonotius terrestris]
MSRRADVIGSDGLSEAILAAIDDGVVVVDEDGAISHTNETAREYFGLSADVTGTPIGEALPHGETLSGLETEPDDDTESLIDSITGETDTDAEELPVLRAHADGVELVVGRGETKRHFIVRVKPLDASTPAAAKLLLFDEISAQRQIESQFETVLDYTADTVAIVRADGTIRYISSVPDSPTEQLTELVDTDNIVDITHPDDKQTVRNALEAASETDNASIHHCRLETAGNGWKMFEIAVRENDSIPAIDGLILTARDVTDQHHFEQRRQVMNRILRHDLRNDMNVVVGHAEMLCDSDDRVVASHAETIRKKALSLVNLGDKVRTIDKQLHGVERDLRQVHLSQIVREEIDELHGQYPSVIIRSRIEEASIIGNTLVRIAISNVLDNSIVHNDNSCPEIEIDVTHRTETGRVEVEIRDNGPGIPEGEKRAITNEAETPLEHISGLGLWLVKWIVDGMDGTLSITENSPRGTVVTLSFIAADGSAAEAEDANTGAALDPSGFSGGSMADSEPIGTTTRSEK